VSRWFENTIIIYIDLQDPRCFSVKGWLALVSRRFDWRAPAATLVEFAECIEVALSDGLHPILCLDEFEELAERRAEFSRDFFMTLRSCSQRGLSIVTGSQRPLSEITDSSDPTSPFYNTFPLLPLGPFVAADAEDFVSLYRAGVAPFNVIERQAILILHRGTALLFKWHASM
jgi:hypothetical protein